MNNKIMKVVKVFVPVASIGVTLLSNYFADKALDDKVNKKVVEALSKSTNGES